jgi:cobalt-zinc-cadmium efflux system outer membrane protein
MASIARPTSGSQVLVVSAVLLAATGAAVVRAQTPAPQGPTLTLADAESRALASNQTIAAARLQRAVDAAGVEVARERPNPELSFDDTRDTPRQALDVIVPFELGGKRSRRVDLAQAVLASGEAELAHVIIGVQNDVRRAYYQVVAADARVTLADDVQALAQRARDAAQARFTAGEVAQSDVSQADLALDDTVNDATDARGEALAARAELNTLIGQPASTALVPAGDLTAGPVPSLADALTEASTVNAELAVLDRQIAEESARVNVAKSEKAPDFNAGGGVTWNAEPDFSVGWHLHADVVLPLFTQHQAGVTLENAELDRLKSSRTARAAQIAGDVTAAYARLTSARTIVEHTQTRTLPLSVDVERMAQSAYAAGERNLTDLLQVLQQVRDIRLKALQSSLDFQLALADLEQAIGAPIR